MISLRSISLAIAILAATVVNALAEKRVALVIGNSNYKNVTQLQNPGNDAAAIIGMFKKAGFDAVDSKLDVNVVEMRRALREFGNKARDADIAVVYYAGHGIELDGNNFLIPIDAALETDTDVYDEAFPLDRIMIAVEPAKQLRLVILDACRDNPFAKKIKRTIGSRAVGRGLAKVEPSNPNTMIAFAAKAGSTASDGDSKNSPFAIALINHLPKPGLDLRKAFGFVRDDVLKATNNTQEPFVYGSLGGNDVALVPLPAVVTAPADQDAPIRRDYEFALQLNSRAVWDAFVEKHPSGFYTALARAQRDKLAAEGARIEATNKAKAALEEQSRLAIEGAKAADQARAAEQAKAAESARIAAERAKTAEEAKVAEAERAKAAAEKKVKEAALAPPAARPDQAAVDLPRSLQSELRRVGCNTGAVDGNWNAAAQKSLDLFNKHSGMKLDVNTASVAALEAVRAKSTRVCPLTCEYGFMADGDRCTKITCRAGYELGNANTCEKIEVRKPTAKREEPEREKQERAKADAASAKPQAAEQMVCGSGGCRPVSRGCRLGEVPSPTNPGARLTAEVCN